MAGGISIHGKPYDTTYATPATGANAADGWTAAELSKVSNTEVLSLTTLADLMNLTSFDGTETWTLNKLLSEAGNDVAAFSDDAATLAKELVETKQRIDALEGARSELTKSLEDTENEIAAKEAVLKDSTATAAEKASAKQDLQGLKGTLTALKSALEHTDQVLKQLLDSVKTSIAQAEDKNKALAAGGTGTFKGKDGKDRTVDLKQAFNDLKGHVDIAGNKLQDALDAKAASKPGAKAAAGGSNATGGSNGTGGSSGANGARAAAGGGPFGQARGANGPGFPPLDMNALLMSNYMQQNQLEGQDAMHKTENESKRMMLLFFMLARMAMSGDVGAMYQFLRFIGHIVNKDKAMQNVQLARKLIELQDVSRKLTQMLVDAPAHDEDDQGVQAEYMKLQQKVQAEQGVIATSQKLIAQMLEEFTQVSEMMTGMVKSLLDARGRELSMLAVWRA